MPANAASCGDSPLLDDEFGESNYSLVDLSSICVSKSSLTSYASSNDSVDAGDDDCVVVSGGFNTCFGSSTSWLVGRLTSTSCALESPLEATTNNGLGSGCGDRSQEDAFTEKPLQHA